MTLHLFRTLSACAVLLFYVSQTSAQPVTILQYDIADAIRVGGGWDHNFDGTIVDTGMISVSDGPGNFDFIRADYSNGSGTLNDNAPGLGEGNTQLFARNNDADPVITLQLDGVFNIFDITLQSFENGNTIPGNIASFDVSIGGLTETFITSEPIPHDEFVDLLGSSLQGVGTDVLVLSNFVLADAENEFFAIGEIEIRGQLVPEPSAVLLVTLIGVGFGFGRRR